jgi:hypothetical protein
MPNATKFTKPVAYVHASYKKAAAKYVMSNQTSYEGRAILQMLTVLLHEGKHEGEEFINVFNADWNYVRWLTSHEDGLTSDNLRAFCEFCRKMQVLLENKSYKAEPARNGKIGKPWIQNVKA